jgi:hypothetical protein
MSDEHLDQVLADLAAVVHEFRVEYLAVDSLAGRLDDEEERQLEERAAAKMTRSTATPEAQRSVLSLRRELAVESARQHHAAFRGLVAWWADAAMIAVLHAAHGRSPDAVRIAAGDPCSWMTAEDLEHLPSIPARDRGFAALSLSLASAPALPGDRTSPGRAPTLVEDGKPEARRLRLWGRDWQEHRMPLLVDTAELTELLTQLGVPAHAVDAISEVSTAVEAVRESKSRIARLNAQLEGEELSEDAEQAAYAEIDQWLVEPDVTDDRLIEYARTLTASLPVIRASRSMRACSSPWR